MIIDKSSNYLEVASRTYSSEESQFIMSLSTKDNFISNIFKALS